MREPTLKRRKYISLVGTEGVYRWVHVQAHSMVFALPRVFELCKPRERIVKIIEELEDGR